MSLQDWANNGWLRRHATSRQEIHNLFKIVHRDLRDSYNTDLSSDWRFGIAYNAALKLCMILLYASGYRPEKNLAHYRTIQSLAVILGGQQCANTDYLESCRTKRNTAEYDYVDSISVSEVEELIEAGSSPVARR
ncbi:MAG: hypothetical protein ABIA75_14970 [Candidatus Neomarinimicrobiota bacterium]